jgi:hypothetical protein
LRGTSAQSESQALQISGLKKAGEKLAPTMASIRPRSPLAQRVGQPHDRFEQIVLVAEVMQHDALRHAGALGDLGEGRSGDPRLLQDLIGRFRQLFPSDLLDSRPGHALLPIAAPRFYSPIDRLVHKVYILTIWTIN